MDSLPEIDLSFSPGSEWKPTNLSFSPGKEPNLEPNPIKRFLERAKWSWKSAYENGKIVEYKEYKDCRRILAYYIPYSVDKNNWGIYLIWQEIKNDIDLLNNCLNNVGIKADIFPFYISLIFIHELTHHVIEDWRTSSGTYSYLPEDESLCEYTAFTLTQAILGNLLRNQAIQTLVHGNHMHIIRGIVNGGIIGFPVPGFFIPLDMYLTPLRDVKEFLSLIYYYWSRDTDPLYKPLVPAWVNEKKFVRFLSQNLTVGLDSAWNKNGLPSVYTRVRFV
ncbi:hypothetical protein [Acidianus ambivalens]|uniref:Uncharacterized protein n=1 Tax=Acidianus ambivalens TaxID=2283 RepID=A0A650CWP4_ACIAM|nr:hypothetical protein [Acidianus ambivalens]MQL54277.1 hypothetical protein [Acidianus ambivalens]QGR22105.1 hypothetical protein D1866_08975 [Acidianus ambivalens]